jgi:hypothetical protein
VQQNVGVEHEMFDVAVVAHFPSMVAAVVSRVAMHYQQTRDN